MKASEITKNLVKGLSEILKKKPPVTVKGAREIKNLKPKIGF